MVLYFQLPVSCIGVPAYYSINCEYSGKKSNTNLTGFFIAFTITYIVLDLLYLNHKIIVRRFLEFFRVEVVLLK